MKQKYHKMDPNMEKSGPKPYGSQSKGQMNTLKVYP